jgi:hypothetical protein
VEARPRREKRAVSRRLRLERRTARRLLDRHDRPGVYAFLDAQGAELPPLPADAPLGSWQEFLSR